MLFRSGFVDSGDLPDLYCGADLFVFPSLFEGFGMPILEAMACGVPVACSNVSSLPEVAGETALQFDPNDEKAIAKILDDMLSRPEVLGDRIEAGLVRARQSSWTEAAKSTLKGIHVAVKTV